ncbi:hypothetical protein ACLOJK_025738 [Asimina triloba]
MARASSGRLSGWSSSQKRLPQLRSDKQQQSGVKKSSSRVEILKPIQRHRLQRQRAAAPLQTNSNLDPASGSKFSVNSDRQQCPVFSDSLSSAIQRYPDLAMAVPSLLNPAMADLNSSISFQIGNQNPTFEAIIKNRTTIPPQSYSNPNRHSPSAPSGQQGIAHQNRWPTRGSTN